MVDPYTQWTVTIDPDPIVNARYLEPAERKRWMTKKTARWEIPNDAVKDNRERTCWIDLHPEARRLGSVWCQKCYADQSSDNAINPTQWTDDDLKKLTDRMQKAWEDYNARY